MGGSEDLGGRLRQLQQLVEEFDDRSLADLKEARKQGTFAGDVFDAPDDCETMVVVSRGELRQLRQLVAALLAESRPPQPLFDPNDVALAKRILAGNPTDIIGRQLAYAIVKAAAGDSLRPPEPPTQERK